ncbi:hypothetical protein JOC27_002228 [Sporolactobacillus spathodeae]|uniref:Uncharacterized protein n=1 Tax=Sporolactobacillus spathodeae TaxID=1465502 RepID=A0ABS2QB13_9BACL|nr:hypothetical protein [Sporolactobacillus spathodeae]
MHQNIVNSFTSVLEKLGIAKSFFNNCFQLLAAGAPSPQTSENLRGLTWLAFPARRQHTLPLGQKNNSRF